MGLPQLAIFPFVPFVMRRVDPRVMVAFGMIMFAVSCFMNSFLTHDWGIQQFAWAQLVRAAGQPFMITPLSALSAGSLPQHEQANGSAIFNIMRNLGGSVGLAVCLFFSARAGALPFLDYRQSPDPKQPQAGATDRGVGAAADAEGRSRRFSSYPGDRRGRQHGADRSLCAGL